MSFALQIHSNLSKTKMKFDFGYIWKMYIGGNFTKCKTEFPILIHVFPILLNKKSALIFVFLNSTSKNYHGIKNQSRICDKGVGLSLFPSDSLSFESYEQFVRKSKKLKNDCFFGHFWANFGYVFHIPAIQL